MSNTLIPAVITFSGTTFTPWYTTGPIIVLDDTTVNHTIDFPLTGAGLPIAGDEAMQTSFTNDCHVRLNWGVDHIEISNGYRRGYDATTGELIDFRRHRKDNFYCEEFYMGMLVMKVKTVK